MDVSVKALNANPDEKRLGMALCLSFGPALSLTDNNG